MYSTYVLLQADSACKNVRKLVHDVVPQKRYVVQVICRPANMFPVEFVRASARISYTREIL